MKTITIEQLTKADTKVQQAILDWWKPSVGDLVASIKDGIKYCVIDNFVEAINCCSLNLYNTINYTVTKDEIIPLLTEGQLIEFIESKTDDGLLIITPTTSMQTVIQSFKKDGYIDKDYGDNLGLDLLQSLWEVANNIII